MIVKVEIIKRKQLKHKVESTSFEISVTQVITLCKGLSHISEFHFIFTDQY